MNQGLKNEVYKLGTDEQAIFVSKCAGLTDIELNIPMVGCLSFDRNEIDRIAEYIR